WGRDRINIIKKCVAKILVFFKFEEDLYKTCGIDVKFVGHPLLDTVKTSRSKNETLEVYGLNKNKITIALLPGSRANEINTLLLTMLQSAKLINERIKNTQFIIAKYPELPMEMYKNIIGASELDIKIAEGDTHNIVGAADFAIVASGTATLETAIIGTPLVIVYKASALTYIAYKFVATIPFIGIVNIIAGREIAPELLQHNATPETISGTVVSALSDPEKLNVMKRDLAGVRSSLGLPGASMNAAKAILSMF
ncbi:MAG: lipid-A-disaccharide synthase, partial [Candidatus Omnitrophota bacterium]